MLLAADRPAAAGDEPLLTAATPPVAGDLVLLAGDVPVLGVAIFLGLGLLPGLCKVGVLPTRETLGGGDAAPRESVPLV